MKLLLSILASVTVLSNSALGSLNEPIDFNQAERGGSQKQQSEEFSQEQWEYPQGEEPEVNEEGEMPLTPDYHGRWVCRAFHPLAEFHRGGHLAMGRYYSRVYHRALRDCLRSHRVCRVSCYRH